MYVKYDQFHVSKKRTIVVVAAVVSTQEKDNSIQPAPNRKIEAYDNEKKTMKELKERETRTYYSPLEKEAS